VAQHHEPGAKRDLACSVIGTAIWIPYCLLSERVKRLSSGEFLDKRLQSESHLASSEKKMIVDHEKTSFFIIFA